MKRKHRRTFQVEMPLECRIEIGARSITRQAMRTSPFFLKNVCRIMFTIVATASIAPNALAQSIAFTFDDGPSLGQTPTAPEDLRSRTPGDKRATSCVTRK